MEPNLTSDYEDEFDIKSQAAFSDLIRKPKITATGMNRCVLIRKVIKDEKFIYLVIGNVYDYVLGI